MKTMTSITALALIFTFGAHAQNSRDIKPATILSMLSMNSRAYAKFLKLTDRQEKRLNEISERNGEVDFQETASLNNTGFDDAPIKSGNTEEAKIKTILSAGQYETLCALSFPNLYEEQMYDLVKTQLELTEVQIDQVKKISKAYRRSDDSMEDTYAENFKSILTAGQLKNLTFPLQTMLENYLLRKNQE